MHSKSVQKKIGLVLAFWGLLIICWLSAAPSSWATGGSPGAPTPPPFGVPNQSPLALALLPFSPATAWVGPAGSHAFRLSTAYSSVFTKQSSKTTSLNLDMETFYLALRYDYVPRQGLQFGVEAPLIANWGGFLDNFIEDYHKAFGFPNGGRERVPQNLMRYTASQGGHSLLNVQNDTMGLGDLRLYGQWALIDDRAARRGLSLLGQATLPTGDREKGLGAGSPGFGLGLAFDQGWGDFSFNANAMGFFIQNAKLLEPLDVQNSLAGSASLGWAWTQDLTLMAQLNGATPLFSGSGVQGLDNGLLQWLLGLQYALSPKSRLMLAFAEDIIFYTSPDFTLSLEWRIVF